MPTFSTTETAAVVKIVSRIREIAVLPHVVFRIIETTGSDDASAASIERIIMVDPGFCAKILTAVNSAQYALPRKVASIREAIMFLGVKQVRSMAMTVGVFDLFVGKNDKESLRRRDWWRHSLDTAVCARWLAPHAHADPDESYVAGLLHYIGKTVLDRSDPTNYEKVMAVVAKGVPDLQAETHLFGADHVAVSMAIAEKWGFPERLVQSLDYVTEATEDSSLNRLRATVAIAHALASIAVSGGSDPETRLRAMPEWARGLTNIAESQISGLVDGSITAITSARAA